MEDLKGYIILESAEEFVKPKILSTDYSRDSVVIETILQEAEKPNRNKRIYSKKAIQSGIDHMTFQEKLAKTSLFGEANHPMTDNIERQTTIDQTRMSHLIKQVWWEGNILKGTVAAANTACGQDFAGLIRQGCEVAFSMRGLGGVVRKDGDITRVSDPLLIVTYDWVIFPSHDNAYQTKVIKENAILDALLPGRQSRNQTRMLHEGMLIPANLKESFADYVLDESKQIKTTLDELNIDPVKVALDEGKMMIDVVGKDGTVAKLFMEDALNKEANEFMRRL